MGSAFLFGIDLVKIAEKHGWVLRERAGGNHPYILEMPGKWCVPVRYKLKSRFEVIGILKQLGIPRTDWPSEVC
jgi:hypothetical protein